MTFADSKGLKTSQWVQNELLEAGDLNYLGQAVYQNLTDLAAIMAYQGVPDSNTPDVVLGGLQLVHDTTLTMKLKAGIAVSFDGSYLESDTWGFSASSGKPFSVIVPADQSVVVQSGGSADRIDIVEIRPIENEYNSKIRSFKDPVTGLVSNASVETRKAYSFEVQVRSGTEGAGVAPAKTAGWIKAAEVTVAAGASAITQSNIKDVRGAWGWTTETGGTTYPVLTEGFRVPIMTTNERNAIEHPKLGALVYNSEDNRLQVRGKVAGSSEWTYTDGTSAAFVPIAIHWSVIAPTVTTS